MSDLEDALVWQIKVSGLPAPVRQLRFAAAIGRKWQFDLAWPDRKLAVEIDGGTFVRGGHNRGAQIAKDMEKANTAVLAGWRLLRADTDMVVDGRALAWIVEALQVAA